MASGSCHLLSESILPGPSKCAKCWPQTSKRTQQAIRLIAGFWSPGGYTVTPIRHAGLCTSTEAWRMQYMLLHKAIINKSVPVEGLQLLSHVGIGDLQATGGRSRAQTSGRCSAHSTLLGETETAEKSALNRYWRRLTRSYSCKATRSKRTVNTQLTCTCLPQCFEQNPLPSLLSKTTTGCQRQSWNKIFEVRVRVDVQSTCTNQNAILRRV